MQQKLLYPNQRLITIHRDPVPKGTKEPFLNINYANLQNAMKDLSNSAFKVYIYFVSNRDNYKMGVSPADIRDKTGVCLETVRKGIRELQNKGYIIYGDEYKYHFYEVQHFDKDNFII